jgi:hypothetical protein
MSSNCSKKFLFAIALAAVALWTSGLSADIVASYAGPHTFDGVDDYVNLSPVSIGAEGRVDLEFKPSSMDGSQRTFWWIGGGGGDIDYQLYVEGTAGFGGCIYNKFGTQQEKVGINGGGGVLNNAWNTASMAWKEGSPTLITVNGSTASFTNAHPLYSFTSEHHDIGDYNWPWAHNYFAGEIRNVVVQNVVPEPAAVVIVATGLIGLLAYAWRKRR